VFVDPADALRLPLSGAVADTLPVFLGSDLYHRLVATP
jgi:hypothetical protein